MVITDRSATDLDHLVPVTGYNHIVTTVVKRQADNAADGLVFLDSNKNPIEGVLYKGQQADGYVIIDMDIPAGTAYIGTTAWTEPNEYDYGNFYIKLR